MMNIKFTEEEKQKLEKSMQLIIKDINTIWDMVKESTTILTGYIHSDSYFREDHYQIIIDNQGIRLHDWKLWDEITIWLARNDQPKEDKKNIFERFRKKEKEDENTSIDYNLCYFIVVNYKKEIKPALLKSASEIRKNKQEGVTLIDDVQKEYDKYASIELMLSTQNQQKIYLTEEEGRTVGTIKIGENIIKIVTNGDIVLKDSTQPPQAKKKVLHE